MGPVAHQSPWVFANPDCELTAPARRYGRSHAKGFLPLKGHLLPHHVITRPGELLGDRLDRDQLVRGGAFMLIKPFDL